jgi:hypothetical protein
MKNENYLNKLFGNIWANLDDLSHSNDSFKSLEDSKYLENLINSIRTDLVYLQSSNKKLQEPYDLNAFNNKLKLICLILKTKKQQIQKLEFICSDITENLLLTYQHLDDTKQKEEDDQL